MYHILVVDDEAKIREIIKKYALFEGYRVSEAANGMEAIDLKLFSAIIVAAAIFIPDVIKLFRKKKKEAA